MTNVYEFIIKDYIEEIKAVCKFAKQVYQSCQQTCGTLQKKIEQNFIKKEKNYEYYIMDQFIEHSVQNKTIEYIQLSNQLQGLCTLWELRMLEFFKVFGHKQAIKKMHDEYHFDLAKDKFLNEIWLTYNVIKHGKEGQSGKSLKDLNSHYLENSIYFAGITENNGIQVLNISENDIDYFTEQIIRFWRIIIDRLPKG